MRVSEALSVEGTSRFVVLCYGVFPMPGADLKCNALRKAGLTIHKLRDDSWPNCVLVNEVSVFAECDISNAVSAALTQMFDDDQCLAALCMYDGAFGGYGDLFAPAIASQIYAFALSKGSHVINLDEDLLSSSEWSLMVDKCSQRFG
jgi:hypothetical protein